MKILAVHNAYNPDQNKRPATDMWRIARPLEELAKHVDWTIDHRTTLLPNFDEGKQPDKFTEAELQAAYDDVSQYDIVFSSYRPNPTMYTLLKVLADKAGTQFIMDVDDDMFAINPTNPIWLKLTDEQVYWMQRMVADNAWISTTTQELAKTFRERRKGHSIKTVFVNPNYISDAYKEYSPDNGNKIVIGFFGGSSHYEDLHNTGFLPALEKLMHEHKNLRFKSVGMPIDKYLPKARVEIVDPKRGDAWLNGIFPDLNIDISVAPLEDTIFNKGKSDIKWQESTRAGALFVASNIGPYKKLMPDTAVLCANTEEDWYRVLKKAVEDAIFRNVTVANARAVLKRSYRLETHWQVYEKMFETVMNSSRIKVG